MMIEPETEVMQSHLRCQAGLEASQGMWAFFCQPKVVVQFLEDRLNDLAQPSHPATQRFRPRMGAGASRPTNDQDAIVCPPVMMPANAFKAGIHHIDATDRLPATWQPLVGVLARGKEGFRQWLIFGAGWREAKASNQASGRDRRQQMEAFIPAQPIAPATNGLSGQPSSPTPLGITSRDSSAIRSAGAATRKATGKASPRRSAGACRGA